MECDGKMAGKMDREMLASLVEFEAISTSIEQTLGAVEVEDGGNVDRRLKSLLARFLHRVMVVSHGLRGWLDPAAIGHRGRNLWEGAAVVQASWGTRSPEQGGA